MRKFGKRGNEPEKNEPEKNKELLVCILAHDPTWRKEFAKGFEAFLVRKGCSLQEREELLQQTRVEATISFPKYRGDRSPTFWLWGIGRNCWLDMIATYCRERDIFDPGHADDALEHPKNLTNIEGLASPSAERVVLDAEEYKEREIKLENAMNTWFPAREEVLQLQPRHLRPLNLNDHIRARYSTILRCLQEQRDDQPKKVYRIIAETLHRQEEGNVNDPDNVFTLLNNVPMWVRRAKEAGRGAVQAVAQERNLEVDFVRWVTSEWELNKKG